MAEERWEQQHKEWIKNVFMDAPPESAEPPAAENLWKQMTEVVRPHQAAETPARAAFPCDQCGMVLGSRSAQTAHARSHGRAAPEPYRCNDCGKTFAVPARLVRHSRTHTGERPYGCEFCPKMFSVKENLQVHRRIHTKERPYVCGVCQRAFEHSGKLHRHMRIHTGERPHACAHCPKTFIQSGQLVIHMRTHTGEKPYLCTAPACGKGFTCSKQLKVHLRTHTGEKPYHCEICFRDFGYNHVLKVHRVQHFGAKCYKCTICDDTFKTKKEMDAHIKGHAPELPQHGAAPAPPPAPPPLATPVPTPPAPAAPPAAASVAFAFLRGDAFDAEYAADAYPPLAVIRRHACPPMAAYSPPDGNIVRCVEAALATVPLMGAPRSPDEAPAKEMSSLPLRKRKIYLSPPEAPPVRVNSVIQFARAS